MAFGIPRQFYHLKLQDFEQFIYLLTLVPSLVKR